MRHARIFTSMAICAALALPGMTLYEVMQTVRWPSYGEAQVAPANESEEETIHSLGEAAGVHLFGVAETSEDMVAVETALALALKGVTQSDNVPDGGAVIAYDGTERLFRVGEALPGGMVLLAVHRDWIELENKGIRERLGLKRLQNAGFVASE